MAFFLAYKTVDQKTESPFTIIGKLHPSISRSPHLTRLTLFPFFLSFFLYISFSIFSFNLTIFLSPLQSSLSHPLLTVFPSFLPPLPFHLCLVLFSFAFSLSLFPPSSFLTCSTPPPPLPSFSLSLILSPCDPVTLSDSPACLLAYLFPVTHVFLFFLSLSLSLSLSCSPTSIFTIFVLNYAGSSLLCNPNIVLLYI